jgi:hypothetical protein
MHCVRYLLKVTNWRAEMKGNRCEVYKDAAGPDFDADIPLTNVHHGSIILVLFLTKQ